MGGYQLVKCIKFLCITQTKIQKVLAPHAAPPSQALSALIAELPAPLTCKHC